MPTPCDGCPEHTEPGKPQGTTLIIFTGGPPYAPFANVARALVDNEEGVVTKWSKPTIHLEGEIEYQQNEAEPPRIEGYQRDASNSRLLRPVWPHCNWRCLQVWRADDGQVKITASCLTPASNASPFETLTLAQCRGCLNLATPE